MSDTLELVLFVAVLVALVWVGWVYEPHWCSKDGHRFTARTRPVALDVPVLPAAGEANTARAAMMGVFSGAGGGRGSGPSALAARWRDARVLVDGDRVELTTRTGLFRKPLPPARVIARGESANQRRAVYLLDGDQLRELRVPVTSRAIPVLDGLLARATGN